MKIKIITMLLLLLGLFTSCATTGSSSEYSAELNGNFNHGIESWIIDFTYENLTTEIKKDKDGNIEEVIKNYGQSDIDLLIIDDFYDKLKNKYKVNILKEQSLETESYGKILIHPVVIFSTFNQFYIEISILDGNDKLIDKNMIYNSSSSSNNGMIEVSNDCLKYILSIIQ